MKETVNLYDYVEKIITGIPHGVLLNTMVDGKVNTMTIGWGSLGFEWGKSIFTAYIREGRYTKELLEKNPEFTISVPMDPDEARKIIKIAGTTSGRDTDKIKEAGITLKTPRTTSVPGIQELPLTLECKVLYTQMQDYKLGDESLAKFYPQDVPSSATGANKDNHLMVIGEIVDTYILKKA